MHPINFVFDIDDTLVLHFDKKEWKKQTEEVVELYGEKFLEKLYNLLEFLIPQYVENEGKHQLVVAIGCTGGRHRSVTIANEIYNRLKASGGKYGLRIFHRDVKQAR